MLKRSLIIASMTAAILASNFASAADTPAAPLPLIDMADFGRNPARLADGTTGHLLTFQSHSPTDFAPMLRGEYGPEFTLNGQLFKPANSKGKIPAVILVPGSANLGPHHLLQAVALIKIGIAVFIIDPFSGRNLSDSVADQGLFSWAASVFDVSAAVRHLRARDDLDAARIGALDGSRGGTAVMMAALRPISEKLLGKNRGMRLAVAGYPWCGTQFRSSQLAPETKILLMSGEKDDWVSVLQCQAAVNALAATGGNAELRLVKDGLHAFDRGGVAPRRIEHAITSTTFPIVYMNDAGQYFDLYTGKVDPSLTGADLTRRSFEGGFIRKGVSIGSSGMQAQQYSDDMVIFFTQLKAVRR